MGLILGINCLTIHAEDFEPIPDENYQEPYDDYNYDDNSNYDEPSQDDEPTDEPSQNDEPYVEPVTTTTVTTLDPEHTTTTSETLQEATFLYQVENNEATLISCRTTALQYVKIPESIDGFPVTKISSTTFADCYNVAEIVIPYSVKSIDETSFANCTSLQYIGVASENRHFKSNDGVLYDINGTSIICYPASKEGSEYTIAEGTNYISKNCFSSNSNLKKLEFPKTLANIGYDAFSGCINLKELTINNNVSLATSMFNYCEIETINGYKNSNAELYAEQYLIDFNSIGTLETTISTTMTTTTVTEVTTIPTTVSMATKNTGATLTYYAPEYKDNSDNTEKIVIAIIGVAIVSLIVAVASKGRKSKDDDDDYEDDDDENDDNDITE